MISQTILSATSWKPFCEGFLFVLVGDDGDELTKLQLSTELLLKKIHALW